MPSTLVEFSQQLANAVEKAGQSVVSVLDGGRAGASGTVWRQGIGVAIDHTIQGLEEVTGILPSGKETKAAVTGRDPGTDIALLNQRFAGPGKLGQHCHRKWVPFVPSFDLQSTRRNSSTSHSLQSRPSLARTPVLRKPASWA